MHSKKLANVTAMTASARYDFFLRKAADAEEVWGLFEDGWATAANGHGNNGIPFWPERELAEACATAEWAVYQPRKIAVDEFLERWLPGMAKDALLAVVFPTPEDKGTYVDPSRLAADLTGALADYE